MGTFTYQWKRNGVNIGTNSPNYILIAEDIGTTISVTVTSSNCDGSVTSSTGTECVPQAAPSSPTLSLSTVTSIALNTIPGCEYRRDGGTWQTSTTFSELIPNTYYGFEARMKETPTHCVSPSSALVQFSTEKANLSGTVTIIIGSPVFGETLTANAVLTSVPVVDDLGIISYQWKRGDENIGVNSQNYAIVQSDIGSTITVTVTALNCNGSITSPATAIITKAEQIAPTAPALLSKTPTSIALVSISGGEYRMTGGDWQVNTTFDDLTPNTTYGFEARFVETATHFASPSSQLALYDTDKATLTGNVAIIGSTVFGETLTAFTTELSSVPIISNLGIFSYQWQRDGEIISTDGSFYTLTQDDIGSTITVTVETSNCIGNVSSSATPTVTKASQTAPVAPTLDTSTSTSISINTMTGCEYRINNGNWQSSPLFSGLLPNTTYIFDARKAETNTHFASYPSPTSEFSTTKETQIAPESPTLLSQTSTSITLNEITGCEYRMDSGEWQISTSFGELMPNTSYSFEARKAETDTHFASDPSPSVEFTTTKASQIAPESPTLSEATSTTITLVEIYGCEYNIDGGEYQESPVFEGLMHSTEYSFTQRYAETETHFASPASVASSFSTITVGIKKIESNHFTIYPNPTSGIVYIKTPVESIFEVKLFSTDGRLLQQLRSTEIDLSGYATGIYFLQIEHEMLKVVKK